MPHFHITRKYDNAHAVAPLFRFGFSKGNPLKMLSIK